MNWRTEYKSILWIVGFFLLAYFMPLHDSRFTQAVYEALALVKWYAREHVLLCLVPAFFIAGMIVVFLSQTAVVKYFGASAKKWVSYSIAAVSGTILAVCSCTVLPLFSGIYKRGAGLGPAIAFLYSGPAINILAIILTARILGFELGLARVVGAVLFSVVIGLLMHLIYGNEDQERMAMELALPDQAGSRPLWQTAFHFLVLVGILIFATWGQPESSTGAWAWVYARKWALVILLGLLLGVCLVYIVKLKWWSVGLGTLVVLASALIFPGSPLLIFTISIVVLSILLAVTPGESQEWMNESWGFARQIMPLLGAGVLVAGFLLGSTGGDGGIIPARWISSLVGGNSFTANLFASVIGAFMYFATLTEIPILQGLIANGMGKGPALALLLAGPALSLPNMLVIRSVIGTRKTLTFVALVIVMATVSGLIYGYAF
ncbi:MAG: permease [Candidatus Marinimicrobia bacterium]|nr:permease [Candidatus Neomarinimicrobiota bacterium]